MVLQFEGQASGSQPDLVKSTQLRNHQKSRNRIENGKQLESDNGPRIGTWNVRRLNKPGALQYVLDNYTIDVLAVQEIR